MAQVSSNLTPLLGSSVPGFLMVNIQKYFVISPYPWNYILVLIPQVYQAVVGRWISQSDEIVKDQTSCDGFVHVSGLWFIVRSKNPFFTTRLVLESL